ncbi:hypothetical protein Fcan01_23201 [Folsomia candida]|uniref:Uncharacterized protein n=1 Tax=Folsomia candida TaxID=158441 RepID=A0A226D8V7_FOLCA|nr:hypothetical protein Fcan01_23201 [Folsomia candida]
MDIMVDIGTYLDSSVEVVNEFKKLDEQKNRKEQYKKRQEHRQNVLNEYQAGIERKKQEATDIIKNQLQPILSQTQKQIDAGLLDLVKMVHEKVKEAQNKEEELQKHQQTMADTLLRKTYFDAVDVGASLLKLVPEIGEGLSIGTSTRNAIDRAIFLPAEDPAKRVKEIGEEMKSNTKALEAFKKGHHQQQYAECERQLANLSAALQEIPEEKLGDKGKSLKADIKSFTFDININILDHGGIQARSNSIINASIELLTPLLDDTDVHDLVKTAFGKVRTFGTSSNAFSTFAGKFVSNIDEIELAGKYITEAQAQIVGYRKMENEIYEYLAPMISSMNGAINEFSSGQVHDKSLAALTGFQFKMQQNIKEARLDIQRFTKAVDPNGTLNLDNLILKLDGAMGAVFEIYKIIERNNEQQSQANLLAVLTDEKFPSDPHDNSPLQVATKELELSLVKLNVISFYNRAFKAVMQYGFPFGGDYVKEFSLPIDLELRNDTHVIDATAEKIVKLKQKLIQAKTFIRTGTDSNIIRFTKKNDDLMYTWHGEYHQQDINDLFTGKSILLTTNIFDIRVPDGLKFSTLELQFNMEDEAQHVLLNAQLDLYNIEITHTGNSYYKFQNRFYVMTTPSLELMYGHKKDANGDSDIYNESFNKLSKGDVILSPLTTWIVKLIPRRKAKKFKNLAPFLNKSIDIHLAGDGLFINKKLNAIDISPYYQEDLTLKKIEEIENGDEGDGDGDSDEEEGEGEDEDE